MADLSDAPFKVAPRLSVVCDYPAVEQRAAPELSLSDFCQREVGVMTRKPRAPRRCQSDSLTQRVQLARVSAKDRLSDRQLVRGVM